MRTLDELGISPAPWKYHKAEGMPFYWIDGVASTVCGERMEADARIIAAAPTMYKTLFDEYNFLAAIYEEMPNGQIKKRMLAIAGALAAASGESEVAK